MRRCLVCQRTDPDRAHIKTKGSGGGDEDWNIIDLCRVHHTEQHQIGIITFAYKYASVKTYLEKSGWEIVSLNGFRRLIRKQVS